MTAWIYQFTPGSRPELAIDPEAWTPEDEEVASAHFRRLQAATDAGTVILAGRSPDGVGPAIVVFEADTEEEARAFMEGDPFVAAGLFGADLHPFNPALVRGS